MKLSDPNWTGIGGLVAIMSLILTIFIWVYNLSSNEQNRNKPTKSPESPVSELVSNREPNDRFQQFKLLINTNISFTDDKPNVALVIVSESIGNVYTPANDLAYLLKSNDYHIITNLFDTNKLITKGFIPELLAGKTTYLVSSGEMSRIHHFVVGKLQYSYSFQQNTEVDSKLISCNISFVYQVIDNGGRIVRTERIDVTGPGFSNDEAQKRGLEMLSENYSDRIFNIE